MRAMEALDAGSGDAELDAAEAAKEAVANADDLPADERGAHETTISLIEGSLAATRSLIETARAEEAGKLSLALRGSRIADIAAAPEHEAAPAMSGIVPGTPPVPVRGLATAAEEKEPYETTILLIERSLADSRSLIETARAEEAGKLSQALQGSRIADIADIAAALAHEAAPAMSGIVPGTPPVPVADLATAAEGGASTVGAWRARRVTLTSRSGARHADARAVLFGRSFGAERRLKRAGAARDRGRPVVCPGSTEGPVGEMENTMRQSFRNRAPLHEARIAPRQFRGDLRDGAVDFRG